MFNSFIPSFAVDCRGSLNTTESCLNIYFIMNHVEWKACSIGDPGNMFLHAGVGVNWSLNCRPFMKSLHMNTNTNIYM